MEQFLLIIHIISCLALIGLILIQQGKGAEAGASFGSSASQTVFGSQGTGTFLSRITAIFVIIFFSMSLGLVMLSHHRSKSNAKSIDELMGIPSTSHTPVKKESSQKKQPLTQNILPSDENNDSDIPNTVPSIPAGTQP